MDGMTALKEIMRVCPVPVIVGAADFYLKNALLEENVKPEIIKEKKVSEILDNILRLVNNRVLHRRSFCVAVHPPAFS